MQIEFKLGVNMELYTSRPKKFIKHLQYEIRRPFAGALNILAKIVRDVTVRLFHCIISCSRVNVREKLIMLHFEDFDCHSESDTCRYAVDGH